MKEPDQLRLKPVFDRLFNFLQKENLDLEDGLYVFLTAMCGAIEQITPYSRIGIKEWLFGELTDFFERLEKEGGNGNSH